MIDCARIFLLKNTWRAASRADGSRGLLTSPSKKNYKRHEGPPQMAFDDLIPLKSTLSVSEGLLSDA